jgi:hypothetical protein
VFKDDEDNVLGIAPTAFQRRDDEELSVNWLERADSDPAKQLKRTIQLIGSTMKVGPKARVAVSNVGTFADICGRYGSKVRVLHVPVDGNEPHAEVHRLPIDNMELLEVLATEGVMDHYRCKDIAP